MLHGDETGLNSEDVAQSHNRMDSDNSVGAVLGFLSTSGSKTKGPIAICKVT